MVDFPLVGTNQWFIKGRPSICGLGPYLGVALKAEKGAGFYVLYKIYTKASLELGPYLKQRRQKRSK